MYERFSDRARKVMQLANQEAVRFKHEYIGTEHILLGLAIEGTGIGANILTNLGIDLAKVRGEIENIILRGSEFARNTDILPTPRAKKVIECALEEARRFKHNYVGSEHLLLGMLREEEGVAAQVLMNLGLSLASCRHELSRLLSGTMDSGKAVIPTEPTILPANPDVGIQALPENAREIAKSFDGQIEMIDQEKKRLVAAQDFVKAAILRDIQDTLKELRADFIRQWPKTP